MPAPKTEAAARFIYKRPFLTLSLSFVVIIICLVLASGGLKVTLAPMVWYDSSSIVTQRQFGYETGFNGWADMIASSGADASNSAAEMTSTLDTLYLVFESEDDTTLLTTQKMKKIREIEQGVVGLAKFEEWCQIDSDTGLCSEFNTLTSTLMDADGVLRPDEDYEAIVSSVWCTSNDDKANIAIALAGAEFRCDNHPATTGKNVTYVKHLKSKLAFGGPLKGFESVQIETSEQHRMLGDGYVSLTVAPHLKKMAKEAEELGIRLYFGGLNPIGGVAYGTVLSYLMTDMMLAIGSMMSVFMYLILQLVDGESESENECVKFLAKFNCKGFFLAFMGFFEILISVPMSFGLFALFGSEYISFLQFMGLFIIMGIGADDIFVFIDAYWQSKDLLKDDTEEIQFVHCYRRAAAAMCVTSCTSGVAFFATAISPVPAVAAFGLTMGFMVFCDFFLVITWFPAAVLIGERYLQCCKKPEPPPKKEEEAEKDPWDSDPVKVGMVEKWFRSFYLDTVGDQRYAGALCLFFSVFILVWLTKAGDLKVTGDLPENFDENHMFTRFRDIVVDGFPQSGGIPKIDVSVFFGLDGENPVNRDGLDPQSDKVSNFAYYDSSFDLTKHETQSSIAHLCNAIASNSTYVYEKQVYCFMDDFKDFLNSTGNSWSDGTHGNKIISPEFMDFQRVKFAERFAGGKMKSGVVVMGENGNNRQPTASELTAIMADATRLSKLDVFAFITFNSTLPLKPSLMDLGEMRDWMETFDSMISTYTKSTTVKGVQFCLYWYFMIAGEAIVTTTKQGIAISLTFAALVLLVANRNWILASLAMLTIIGVVGAVAWMMILLDWTVDFLGSVCLIVVIGLSIDYTVHLCHSYIHSPEVYNLHRAAHAATEMGVSIVSGAVTSFWASFFLLLCSMTFFKRFGAFMCATVVISLILSIWFFIPICSFLGPSRKQSTGYTLSYGDICVSDPRKNKNKVKPDSDDEKEEEENAKKEKKEKEKELNLEQADAEEEAKPQEEAT
mmetsp:Transcript_12091/g.24707  ORF Transcript_12091/g.24707 Transcript_12091/m.24707 type:complete len:1010 (+) Transcript_12091:76-3105(+)|eukprot:CAMPEP_0118659228 /NCGR_PEP_ID=MMETSP0785-20121206/14997_1 /TAXON_ID=91992 /ORGANISM="Bolidomonas pacifica, Strain CCMP 1866" /LENGTH=1009 /DNA_ID=CAMNT_0006552313 /DNA_START=60 /DNA_END=3089 /DNA_ORIENTATION=-